jgi:hypothetical protein
MMKKYVSLGIIILFSLGVYAGGPAIPGDDCGNAIDLATLTPPTSSTTAGTNNDFSFCTMGSAPDLIYYYDLPVGSTLTIQQTTNGYDSRHSLRYNGACPGTIEIVCTDDPDTRVESWQNCTGGVQRVWWIQSGFSSNSGTFTLTWSVVAGTCPIPPSNDECSGATAVTVNPDLNCGSVTAGTINLATASSQANTCGGTSNNDVWYSFVATGTVHYVSLLNISGSPTDMYHSVYGGSCGSIGAPLVCSDPNSSIVSGLTPGNTYYIRVYSYSSSTGATTTFNVCVGTPPPPPSNDECAGATSVPVNPNASCGSVVSGTLNSATPSSQSNTCFGTANDDVWYSFVATNSSHYIDLLSVGGSPTDLYHSVYAGSCGSIGAPLVCSDPNSSTVSGLTPGNTYYIRVYSYSSSTGATTTFNVCVGTPPPPPSNDNCGNAISLTMSTDGSCNSVSSTVASATNSMVSACGGTANDDVWFSFVATNDSAYVDRIAEFDSEVEVFNACSGTSLGCQDSETSFLVTGLTVGNTYFIRIHSWSSTVPNPSSADFTICVFGPAPPPANDLCNKMQPICADSPYSFVATQGGNDASTTEPGNNYDCLSTSPNPTWFYLEIDSGGVMSFDITAASDIDFALWGPYSSLANAQAACGSLPVPVDCSYSSTNIEQANANVNAGDVFILLVTNYADVQQPITLNSSSANTASTDCTILPIELMSFDANASEYGNELSWQTLSEINNDYFILETSKDARNFQAIGSVKGAGNSNELLSYYFMDKNPIASITYYRLKQVDFDGKFSYSEVVSVRRIEDGEVVISPNPVKDVLNIEFKTNQAGSYNFIVVDLLGAVIEKNIHLDKGTNNIKLDVFADLPQGFYMLKIMDGNNTIITTKKIVKN